MTIGTTARLSMSILAAALVIVASLIPWAPARATHQATPVTIRMTDTLRFEPEEVTVLVGQRVTWQNTGDSANGITHTVTAYEGKLPRGAGYFDSSGGSGESAARAANPNLWLKPGESFNHTFTVAGDYPYFCVPHEGVGMKGVVHVVTELPATAAETSAVLVVAAGLAAAAIVGAAYVWCIRQKRA